MYKSLPALGTILYVDAVTVTFYELEYLLQQCFVIFEYDLSYVRLIIKNKQFLESLWILLNFTLWNGKHNALR